MRGADVEPERSRAAALCASLCLLAAGCATGSRTDLYFENDTFAKTDRDYTSGLRLDYVVPIEEAPSWSQRLVRGVFQKRRITQVGFQVGHQIYTPEDIERRDLIEDDRPYAAWLWGGLALHSSHYDADPGDRHDRQTTLDLRLGIVGEHAYGEELQHWVHEINGSEEANGWHNQLEDELGAVLTVFQRRRWDYRERGSLGYDALLGYGLSVGNVFTGATLANTLRLGWNLPRDFGTPVVDPHGVAGTPGHVINADASRYPFTLYLFGGADGKAVAQDIFLDGNTFEDSHSVTREELVGDLRAGVALGVGRWRLTVTAVRRTPQFEESGHYQSFGSISVGWTWSG